MLTHLAVLAFSLAAVAPSVAPTGAFVAGEGYRAQLPRNFTYSTKVHEGRTLYVAVSRSRDAFVTVHAAGADADLACDGADGATDSEDDAGAVEGLEGCFVLLESETAKGAFAIGLVRTDELVVGVNVVAPTGEKAEELARSVLRSVVIGGRETVRVSAIEPRADERLVGCFEKSKTHGTLSNGVTAVTTLCLAADFTFTRRLLIRAASTSYVGGASAPSAAIESESKGYGDGETSGTWSFDGEALALEFEDGSQQDLELEFAEAGFVSGGAYWERLATSEE